MEHKNNLILKFIAHTLILFALNILVLAFFAHLFGEGAKPLSTLYQLGSKGLATSTMLQVLLSSASVIALKNLFYSEKIIQKLMTLWRTVLMLFSVLIINIFYILIFDWFSVNNRYAWAGFLICFGGGCILSSLFMIIKTKLESRQYDELLLNYKNQHERDSENE
ncbi:MAG TPA: hypothetical protein VN258_08810 [Mobilitalea sp.]|nr:hypothetical protein [Mobilitalea sp.]